MERRGPRHIIHPVVSRHYRARNRHHSHVQHRPLPLPHRFYRYRSLGNRYRENLLNYYYFRYQKYTNSL